MALLGLPHRTISRLLDSERNWEWLKNLKLESSDLADDSVGSAQIATDAVGSDEIAAGAVGTAEAPTFVNSTVENLKVIRGIINTTGSGSIVAGTGFSITRHGAGDVTITFTAAFSSVPSVTFTPGQTTGILKAKHNAAPTASTARCVVYTETADTDAIFHFIAIGPR